MPLRLLLTAAAAAGWISAQPSSEPRRQPTPQSLSPAAVTAGGPAFTMAVRGQSFTVFTRVLLDGVPVATLFESETRLAAEIPAFRIAKPGPVAVTVTRDKQQVSDALPFTVNPPLDWLTAPSLPPAPHRHFYSQVLGLLGGTPPVRFSLSAGAVPPGLHLDGYNGTVVGFPTMLGQYRFSVRAFDATGGEAVQQLSLLVAAELKISSGPAFPAAVANQVYAAQLIAEGGQPPLLEWKITGGTLPRGLTLDEKTGRIAGTPAAPGTVEVTVRVRDSAGNSATGRLALSVRPPLSIALPDALTDFVEGDRIALSAAVAGGTPPYEWRIESGSLPPGVALDPATGALQGTLLESGSYRAVLRARDTAGVEASTALALSVAQPLEAIGLTAIPVTAGSPVSQSLSARGGRPPYTWRLVGGSLPGGLRLEAGRLVGTTNQIGEFPIDLELADLSLRTAGSQTSLVVSAPPLPKLTFAPLPRLLPGQQTKLDFQLDRVYPSDLSIAVQLGFDGPADPALTLSSGSREARLRVRAGQLAPDSALQLQTGTTAGSLVLEARLESPGRDTASPTAQRATIEATPPQIKSMKWQKTPDGFEIIVAVLSPTREIEAAVFVFDESLQLTVPLHRLTAAWYEDERSAPYGTLMTYRQRFTVTGDASRLRGVSMTVTNRVGVSVPASTAF